MKTMLNNIFGTGNAAGHTCATGRAMSRLARLFMLSVSLAGLGAWGGNADAATRTSTAAGGNWNATTTWVGGVVPLSIDSVIIATTGAGAVTVNVQASMTNLIVNAGSTLTIQGGSNFRIRPTGTTSISGTLNFGTTTSSSRFTGLVTVTATGTWNNAGNQAINFRGGLTNNGGTFTAGTGTYSFTNANQAIGGTAPITIPNVTVTTIALTNNGTLTASATLAGSGSLINSATGILNIGGTSTITTLNAAAVGNTVNYTGAAQTVKATTYHNLGLSGSGAKAMGATTINGNFTMSGTATTAPTGALAVGGNFTIGTGTTFTAGNFNHTVSGNFDATGTFNPGAGTVTLNGAAAQTISGTSPVGFNNLTVTNATNPNITLAANVTVAGTLTGTVTLTSTCPIDYTLTSTTPAQVLHSCSGPNHILITHAGTALTCSPQTVTITACANAACTALYSGGVNVTLTPGGQTFVIDATGVNSTATVQQSTIGTATLVATSVPAAANASTCWNTATSTASCAMTFSDSGFIITVPNHTSCTNATATIEAVQKAPGTGRCVPAYKGVTRAVNLYSGYANPATGTQVITASTGTVSTAAPGTTHNLAFDVNGTATITLSYPDAGQLTLTAGDTAPTGAAMTGSSTFVVAPASFAFSGISAAPLKAGQAFNATVTAMNACAAATPNFGQETTPEGVTVSFTKCQPTGANAVNGVFSGNVGAFTSGAAAANNLNWSEVGNGDLVATLTSGSYLASGLTVTGNTGAGGAVCSGGVGNVGRFIPDHFDTVVTGPMSCPFSGLICPTGGLVYSGQPFTTNVYARNAAGVTTQNYDGTANTSPNFAQAVTLTAWDGPGSTTTQNPPAATPGSITGPGGTIAVTSFNRGATVSPGTPSAPIYTFGTTPTNPTDIYIRAVDADNATSLRVPANISVEGGIKVVNGRIKVSNAYGSELLPLTLMATAQYYTATGWVNSITDSVTNLALAASYPVGAGSTAVTLVPATGNLSSGKLVIRLGAPGTTGSAIINPTAPGYLPVTPGTATFGVYKGNNSYIYRRESY